MNPLLRDQLADIIAEEMAAAHADKLIERAKETGERSSDAPSLPDLATHQPIDISERAQKMHDIGMIAYGNGWQLAITHFLRTKRVQYMSDLTDPQLDDLLDRMQGYVDAAETGCSLADCLPAS